MGCDIHFYVEKWSDEEVTEGPIDISDKRDSLISNVLKLKREYRWISVDKWYRDEGYWTNYGNSFYSGRNYDLFAKLADVRNYDNNIEPLDQPRGIPEDASYAYKLMVREMGNDGHSHSYFTKESVVASLEVAEIESTEVKSKVKVLEISFNNSKYNTTKWKEKIKTLVDNTWINTSDIEWINKSKSIERAEKLDKILN